MCLFPEGSNGLSKSSFSLSKRKQHRCFQCMMQCLHKFVLICFLVRECECNYCRNNGSNSESCLQPVGKILSFP